MNNHLKLTIQSLIATYPLYSQEDILVLDTLSPYADPEVFNLIHSFLYSIRNMDSEISHALLQIVLSNLEEATVTA